MFILCRLKKLSLSNTQVTDAGLPSLRCMQELQELCLDRTAVTSRGVADLITCLPHLQVTIPISTIQVLLYPCASASVNISPVIDW